MNPSPDDYPQPLTREERSAWHLCDECKKTQDEAAEIMGTCRKTITRRLKRARHKVELIRQLAIRIEVDDVDAFISKAVFPNR